MATVETVNCIELYKEHIDVVVDVVKAIEELLKNILMI